MSSAIRLNRLIGCQGSIQLLTAVSVINSRDLLATKEIEYRNYLLIYDLFVPENQVEDFFKTLTVIANSIMSWENIIYLSPGKISELATEGCYIDDIIGGAEISEIYLTRNWDLCNSILINAYTAAKKICYGDGIGINISEGYFSSNDLLHQLKKSIKKMFFYLHLAKYKPLTKIEFDEGYFLLGDVLGDQPAMKWFEMDKKFLIENFDKVSAIFTESEINSIKFPSNQKKIYVILTTNFTESGKTSLENEIKAYKEYFESLGVKKENLLLIKPHPRDDYQKILLLKDTLSLFFDNLIIMDNEKFFYVPFEVFFQRAFSGKENQEITIITFSTACFSYKLLYGLNPLVGFTKKIVNKYFKKGHRNNRLKHEADLVNGLKYMGTK